MLQLREVTIDFGQGPLLEAASLETEAGGTLLGIQGTNGSGKTSLLRVVANVGTPAAGERVGPTTCAYVPPTIDPLAMRSGDWLRLFPRANRHDPLPLLQALHFDSDLSKRLRDLSFGNLRKLLLAEALTSGEELIVIDEFTAGLDRRGAVVARSAVTQLADAGTTIVLADQQDRDFPPGTSVYTISDRSLVPAVTTSTASTTAIAEDPQVDVRLRGPRAELPKLAEIASSHGFEVLP